MIGLPRVVRAEAGLLVAERVGVHEQAALVGALHEVGRLEQRAGRALRRLDVRLPRADAVGVPAPPRRAPCSWRRSRTCGRAASGRRTRSSRRAVVGRGVVERAVGVDVVGVDELDEPDARALVQLDQVRLLEGLDEHGVAALVPAVAAQRGAAACPRAAGRAAGGRSGASSRVDADAAAGLARPALRGADDLLEGRDLVAAVELLRALGDRLDRAQRADLGEREVGGEPAGDGRAVDVGRPLAVGELGVRGDVGGVGDVRLVAGDQVAVLGGDEVGLDVVGAALDGEDVAGDRVLGR